MNTQQYIIIAGTTKSGTGSLFNYLGDHPEICPSNIKETRFFFSSDTYELPGIYQFERDGLEAYQSYFSHCRAGRFRLEATPDYLYSSSAARNIANSFESVQLIFILREPISRLKSWYRFAIQWALIPESLSFEEYVHRQIDSKAERQPQHLCALEQGRYSKYLAKYFEHFSGERICVTRFEHLAEKPVQLVRSLALRCGVEPGYYANYDFKVDNQTRSMRFPVLYKHYSQFRRSVRYRLHDREKLRSILRFARGIFEPIYFNLLRAPAPEVAVPSDLYDLLVDYYRDDQLEMQKVFDEFDCFNPEA